MSGSLLQIGIIAQIGSQHSADLLQSFSIHSKPLYLHPKFIQRFFYFPHDQYFFSIIQSGVSSHPG